MNRAYLPIDDSNDGRAYSHADTEADVEVLVKDHRLSEGHNE